MTWMPRIGWKQVGVANIALEACIGSPFDGLVTLVSCVCYGCLDDFACSLFDVDCVYLLEESLPTSLLAE
jgi:hypothetical protein